MVGENVKSATFNGRRFKVSRPKRIRDRGEECLGTCSDTEIRIVEKASGIDLLDIAVHEGVHAYIDHSRDGPRFLHEDTVEALATDLARFLWDLGFRDGSEKE